MSEVSGSRDTRRLIAVRNVNHPGVMHNVDAEMYEAMHHAMLQALPVEPPGLTQTEILQSVLPHLPQKLFPDGAKAGWWAKTVQLDLEAKGELIREGTKPLRWHRI